MARDSEATKKRILDAAEEEFVHYGIAGARVDRIAENAAANKAMIYRYFESKDRLFDVVFSLRVVNFVDEVGFDPADLPGYAGRAFDAYQKSPNTLRLTNWYALERGDSADLDALVESHRHKIESIERAQSVGALPSRLAPLELLITIRAIAMSWHNLTPEMNRIRLPDVERQRASVVENVRRLVSKD
ncbi:TetR family transcriptional regulator [Rhodococcus sp. NPDC056743]|uniref:TetR family transcriptional regulator n=1 Tax=Rhodococcus sp. NPDC056743 TaxID=3345934 RepID=UPI00366D2453